MNRFHLSLLAILALVFAVGCPPVEPDDDDTTPPIEEDDDDATAADPCEDPVDVTGDIGGSYNGSTNGEDDNFQGSCSNGAVPDLLLVFTPDITGTYALSTDNAGTDYDTVMFAFTECDSPTSSELACNDDGASTVAAYSSDIMFEATAGEDVYVAIEGYDGTGNFELSIGAVVCGDGVVSGTELCDDGNTDNGDGCDESCIWECTDDDNEPDSTLVEATDIDETALPVTLADQVLCPTDWNEEYGLYIDFWLLTLADAEAYISLQGAGGASLTTTCAEQSMVMMLLDADLNNIGSDDSTDGECPYAVAEPGVAADYYIAVFWDDQSVPPQDYSLTITSAVSVCGDGTLEGVEECDDGNTDAEDGCTPGCITEDAECPLEDGDLVDSIDGSVTGSTTDGPMNHTASCSPATAEQPDVAYIFTAAEDGPIIFSLDNDGTTFDTVLYVRDSCVDPLGDIACHDDVDYQGGNLKSVVGIDAVAGTDYAVIIDGWEPGDYQLDIRIPECGDGIVEGTEDCDDGNEVDGDGCESDCTVTPMCANTVNEDLGVLGSATITPDLAAEPDDLPDVIGCADVGVGGGDYLVSFEIEAAGDLTISVDHAGGGDAQYALFQVEPDCEQTEIAPYGVCVDIYPDTAMDLTVAVTPGVWMFLADAYNPDLAGPIEVSFSVE
jgi:cysteine-rich repeat protein